MNAARLIGIEEIKANGRLIYEKNRGFGMANLPFSELDTRDWILTPELHDTVTQLESNFNITGNPERNHIRLTHNLKIFLKDLQSKYPPDIIRRTSASIFQCLNVFLTNLSSHAMGRKRAIAAYQLLDRELEISANVDATCRKGCIACCHLDKEITYDEADLLAFFIKNKEQIDMQLLAKQIAKSCGKGKKGHRARLTARCPFLGKDHLCMVYEYRPMVCRKYSVASPPAECSKKDGMIKQIPMIAEEVVVSAALSCYGNYFGSMPVMLGRALVAEDGIKQIQNEIDVFRIRDDSTGRTSDSQKLRNSQKESAGNEPPLFKKECFSPFWNRGE